MFASLFGFVPGYLLFSETVVNESMSVVLSLSVCWGLAIEKQCDFVVLFL